MSLKFEWDSDKAVANVRKHLVSFEEAAAAFGDPLSVTIPDPHHSKEEERYILLGESGHGRLVVVVHTERADNIRIISARQATPKERKRYEEA